MTLAALFVDDGAVPADLYGLTVMTLQLRPELDAAVSVAMVAPVARASRDYTLPPVCPSTDVSSCAD
jgi:hypothetical protein